MLTIVFFKKSQKIPSYQWTKVRQSDKTVNFNRNKKRSSPWLQEIALRNIAYIILPLCYICPSDSSHHYLCEELIAPISQGSRYVLFQGIKQWHTGVVKTQGQWGSLPVFDKVSRWGGAGLSRQFEVCL